MSNVVPWSYTSKVVPNCRIEPFTNDVMGGRGGNLPSDNIGHSTHHPHPVTEVVVTSSNGVAPQDTIDKTKVTRDERIAITDTGGTAKEKMNYAKLIGKLFISLVCGIIFGFAMEKGRVFAPRIIRGQFIFTKFVMLKMFLAAGAVSLLLMGLLSVLPPTKNLLQEAKQCLTSSYKSKGLLTTAVGGFILGAGMQLSGSCPGMVLVQVGTWVGNGSACVTLVAGLLAAILYGFIEPYISKLLSPNIQMSKLMFDDYTSLPFIVLTIVFGLVMVAIVVVLEFAYPWQDEVHVRNETSECVFAALAWPPYISGIIIGCLQVPLIILIGDTIGGSQSYCTIASQLLITERLRAASPYLVSYRKGIGNWWQVCYVIGAILGGLFSALASGSLDSVPGVGYALSFVGGFCCIFGARLAAGCTSGHGLSGVGCLSLLSFVAVPSMFAGGISVGFIMKASVGSLDEYYTI